MSPKQVMPVERLALSPIAESVLKLPTLSYEASGDGIVIAKKAELIVRRSALTGRFAQALKDVATPLGTISALNRAPTPVVRADWSGLAEDERAEPGDYDPPPDGPFSDLEIWLLKDSGSNSLDESRRLRALVPDQPFRASRGSWLLLPAVSPNHVAILSASAGGCPATPPTPARERDPEFVKEPTDESPAKVTILDSGYIWTTPPHLNLDRRVTVVRGQWLDTSTNPATWRPDKPDGLYTDAGQLDGISGHGTFIAGLISHIAPCTLLEVVGLRNQEVEIGPLGPVQQLGLFETEAAIAHAMLRRADTDVIQCGFAFPTLDDYPSLPFAAVMAELRKKNAPRQGQVAVVAPAGNEQSPRRHWPAALPDVIGVASTNRRETARAWFSNWGDWCDCCTRGEDVYSTFVNWDGSVQGRPLADVEHFHGWATWNGTSFAAPKVSARIAQLVAKSDPRAYPAELGEALLAGTVSTITDGSLSGPPGVPLPYLQI